MDTGDAVGTLKILRRHLKHSFSSRQMEKKRKEEETFAFSL